MKILMKNVKRLNPPPSLESNATKWTQELLQEIDLGERPKYRYRKKDVRDQLKKMYSSLCCYCESKTETTGFGQIEHRLPKKHFPEKTYDWNNLHWSCFRCNHTKGDFFDNSDPVLDSTKDNILQHLKYDGLNMSHLTLRGKNTIESTKLNRSDLKQERKKILSAISSFLDVASSKNVSKKRREKAFMYLAEFKDGEYGSFVEYILGNGSVEVPDIK